MSQLSDVIYVPNEEKHDTLHFGIHLRYDWDEDAFKLISMREYTEYFQRCRIEEFIRAYAPELEEKLEQYLNSFSDEHPERE